MKIFTPEEVKERIEKFNEYMMEEKELQEELLSLNISGSADAVRCAGERHDEIIEEIESLRNEKMLPILDEMAKFVAYCQKVEKGEIKLGDPFPGEEKPEDNVK